MTWIVLLIVVAVAGLCLTLLGLRGRRVDAHPLCRRCGFDLTGNPDAAICNECGADLTRPRAVEVGHRARRRLPLTLGLSLLVPCLLVGLLIGYVAVRGTAMPRAATATMSPMHAAAFSAKSTTRSTSVVRRRNDQNGTAPRFAPIAW